MDATQNPTVHLPNKPLIVALDGGLTPLNTIQEIRLNSWCRWHQILSRPKDHTVTLDPVLIPYRAEVLALIHRYRAAGNSVYLQAGPGHPMAESVAAHLNCFEAIIRHNPNQVVPQFGQGSFDYVGNLSTELRAWPGGRSAATRSFQWSGSGRS